MQSVLFHALYSIKKENWDAWNTMVDQSNIANNTAYATIFHSTLSSSTMFQKSTIFLITIIIIRIHNLLDQLLLDCIISMIRPPLALEGRLWVRGDNI